MISNELLFLKILELKGSIYLLKKRGLTYSQIALIMQQHLAAGYIKVDDSGVIITENGVDFLHANMKEHLPRTKDGWILPQEHLYKAPISTKKIILPKNI